MTNDKKIQELIEYVQILLDYAQDNNKGVTAEQISRFHKARETLNGEELEILYNELASLVHPVTIDTLYATDDMVAKTLDEVFGEKKPVPTPREATKKSLSSISWITAGLLLLVIASSFLDRIIDIFSITPESIPGRRLDTALILLQAFLITLIPFTYGAIGACAYVLIEGHLWVWNKIFDANLIPRDRIKILIGALSGVVVIELLSGDHKTAGSLEEIINLKEGGLAFIAGYSTDFLFETIKRIVAAVLPRVEQVVVIKERRIEPKDKETPLPKEQVSGNKAKTTTSIKQALIDKLRKRI